MKIHRSTGVCTWSLQNDLASLQEVLRKSGLNHIHLGLDALLGERGDSFQSAIADNNWTISSTMTGFSGEDYSTLESIRRTGGIMPDAEWEENRNKVIESVILTTGLEVPFLSMHAGFIDHSDKAAYRKFCDRMSELAEMAFAYKVTLLMETGQETAADLKQCLQDLNHPAIGVNFDPANMILYGKGDPIEAIHILGPWIRHVHVKDALKPAVPGEWGQEVPWGDGEVDCSRFLSSLDEIDYKGVLSIEREAGTTRQADILLAIERLKLE